MNFSKHIVRDGSYVKGHGSYIADYRDEEGGIFHRVMQLSDETAREMLAEAIAGMNDDIFAGEDRHGHTRMNVHYNFRCETWMRVSNKDFVCFSALGTKNIVALYRHDYRNYLVEANIERLRRWVDTHSLDTHRGELEPLLRGE